jgi:hypothetical protein
LGKFIYFTYFYKQVFIDADENNKKERIYVTNCLRVNNGKFFTKLFLLIYFSVYIKIPITFKMFRIFHPHKNLIDLKLPIVMTQITALLDQNKKHEVYVIMCKHNNCSINSVQLDFNTCEYKIRNLICGLPYKAPYIRLLQNCPFFLIALTEEANECIEKFYTLEKVTFLLLNSFIC